MEYQSLFKSIIIDVLLLTKNDSHNILFSKSKYIEMKIEYKSQPYKDIHTEK